MTLNTIINMMYVGGCLSLPFFLPLQHLNGRAYPFIMMTLGHVGWTLVSGGGGMVWDGMSVWMGVITFILLLGLLRSSLPPITTLTTIQWIATMWLFMVARTIPPTFILLVIFGIGFFFSVFELREWWRKDTIEGYGWVLFGNSNHNSLYYAMCAIIGLSKSGRNLMYLLPTTILILATLTTKARAASLALILAGGAMGGWLTFFGVLVVGGIIGGWKWRVLLNGAYGTSEGNVLWRVVFWKMAWKLIKKAPFGMGVEAFRRESASLYGEIQREGGKLGTFVENQMSISNISTHRVHNDFLELVVEVGWVGMGVMLVPLFFLPYTPLVIGLVMLFGVVGMFFFPFREIPSSLAFVAILATTIPQPITIPHLPFLLVGVGMYGVVFVGWEVWKRWKGLWNYGKIQTAQSIEEIGRRAVTTLECEPTKSLYLSKAASIALPYCQEEAYENIAHAIHHYDGETRLWELYYQFAITILYTTTPQLALYYLNKALEINPSFKVARELLEKVSISNPPSCSLSEGDEQGLLRSVQ